MAESGVACTPYLRGKTNELSAEEALKILHTVDESKFTEVPPNEPSDGDVYVYFSDDKNQTDGWKNDGHQWRIVRSVNIPRRNPIVLKRSYAHLMANGKDESGLKRDVYMDISSENTRAKSLALLHFQGKYVCEDIESKQQVSSPTSIKPRPGSSQDSKPEVRCPDTSQTDVCSAEADSVTLEDAGSVMQADSSTNTNDIESALATLKSALQKKSGTQPVMDMVNKLVETVTSNDDSAELDYCLVVSDKKSGRSSIIGTPEIASPRRSARKRPIKQAHDELEEADHIDDSDDNNEDVEIDKKKPKLDNSSSISSITELGDQEVLTAKGLVRKYPKVKKELFFSFSIVSDEEKEINSDFFDGRRATKNRDRYLKIRNHMILTWQKQKPRYLSISQARKGLKDCGDVTPMTRIHKFLECKGVINFNSVKSRPWLRKDKTSTPQNKRRKVDAIDDDVDVDDDDDPVVTDAEHVESLDDQISNQKDQSVERASASVQSAKKRKTNTAGLRKVESGSKGDKVETSITDKADISGGNKSKFKTPVKADSVSDSPGTRSSRRTRNVSTPNWADIISGRKSFKKDGGVLINIKTEPESEVDDDKDTELNVRKAKKQKAVKAELKSTRLVEPKERMNEGEKINPNNQETKKSSAQNVSPVNKPMNVDVMMSKGTSIATEDKISPNTSALSDIATAPNTLEKIDAGTEVDASMVADITSEDVTEQEMENVSPAAHRSGSRVSNKFACSECDRKFGFGFLLEQHMKTVHGKHVDGIDAADEEMLEELDGDEDDDYAAEVDEVENGEDDDLDSSNETKKKKLKSTPNKNTKGKKPKCEVCGQVFLSEANLKRHNLLHTNKMYECPFCAKIMKRKDYVNTHVRKVHKDINLDEDPIDFDKYTHVLAEGDGVDKDDNTEEDVKPLRVKIVTGLGKKVCPECNKLFDSNEELESHMIEVHNKELKDAAYTCQGCKKQFKTLVSYQVHKLSHRKKNHVCQHCGETFINNSQLQVHRRHDHQIQYGTLYYFGYVFNDNKICCEICSTEFENMDDYHKHRPDHLTYKYLCRTCGNGFGSESELEKHVGSNCSYVNLHLACGVCSLKFSMYDTRRKHVMSSHKKTTEFYCHHCGKCFESMDVLTEHFNAHKEDRIYTCEICDKRFFEKRNLVDHRDLHNSTKDWQCHICNRYYLSSKSLQRHIKLHLNKSTKNCKHCDEKFSTMEDLNQHVADTHSDLTEDSELKCKVCSKSFLDNSRLLKHMQIHDGKNTYTCELCDSQFDANYLPQWKHMKKAHPAEYQANAKKTYYCDVCDFSTFHKQRLERHAETHNETKNFECQYCGRRYQTTSSLLTHMIVHRGKVKKGAKPQPLCTWPHCSKQFIKHSLYKRHLMSHIFRIKMGKDLCDCGKCQYSAPLAGQSYFVHDDLEYSHVGYVDEDGNPLVAAKLDAPPTDSSNKSVINLQVLSGDGDKGYDTMEVLQEAIAQIEDIENKTSPETADKESKVIENLPESNDKIDTETDAGDQGEIIITDNDGKVEFSNVEMSDNGNVVSIRTTDAYEVMDVEGVSKEGTSSTETSTADAGTQSVDQVFVQSANEILVECGYECGVCELMFHHKCQVLNHLETDHPEHAFPQCHICTKVIIDKKNLLDHMVIHEDSKKFKCDVCSKSFRTKQCLKQHSYVHASQKPFTCNFCGHGFTQKGFYLEHIRRHTGIKPFKCFVCQKAFVSKNLLRIHMYSHANTRPHKCDICPKSFSENYLLVAHMRTHNDDRPFECSECEKSFFVRPKLMRHLNVVHGIAKEQLTNYVPTRVGDGIGYRDKTKMSGNASAVQTAEPTVVYINSDGHIVSQEMKNNVRNEQPQITINRPIKMKPNTTFTSISGQPAVMADGSLANDDVHSFEVVTKRDEHGSVQVNPVMQEEITYADGDRVEYHDTKIELDGQNYTLVTQGDGQGEGHITLIAQTFDGAQDDIHIDDGQGEIQVITQEVADGELIAGGDENMRVITQAEIAQNVEDGEKFSINIGEDGTVDMADFDKIEALRSMYGDQQIVIVVESQQQEG